MALCFASMWATLWSWSNGECSPSDYSSKGKAIPPSRSGVPQVQSNQSCTFSRTLLLCRIIFLQGRFIRVPKQNADFPGCSSWSEVSASPRMCVLDLTRQMAVICGSIPQMNYTQQHHSSLEPWSVLCTAQNLRLSMYEHQWWRITWFDEEDSAKYLYLRVVVLDSDWVDDYNSFVQPHLRIYCV